MEATPETDKVLEVGRFRFSEAAFAKAKQLLQQLAAAAPQHLAVVDEVGPLELRQEGFYPELNTLAQHYCGPQVWVVRQSCVEAVITTFNLQHKTNLQIYHWPELDLLKSYFLRTFTKT